MVPKWAIKAIPLVFLSSALGSASQQPQSDATSQKTVFVGCGESDKPTRVLSPVSTSEDGMWRAYVEVDVRGDLGCLYTTRLWVAEPNAEYRVLYLIPPERTAVGNGMEILGWAKHSRMFLVKTEEWQRGSDALDRQTVLAIDAGTGIVYEPQLEAIIQAHAEKQCSIRVTDAGFATDKNVEILVRAQISTALDVGDTERDVPLAKRCANTQETWSFDYGTGEVKQVANTERMQLVKRFLPNRRDK
ncbi:MAG: hypothetical protein WB992_02320 [Bryobacteraceae bacterium]